MHFDQTSGSWPHENEVTWNISVLQYILFSVEISKKVQEKEEKLSSKEEEIKNLEQKLKTQEITYKKQLTDAEIQRRQEQYISKLLEEQDKKKSRPKVLGVPKQKHKWYTTMHRRHVLQKKLKSTVWYEVDYKEGLYASYSFGVVQ